MALYNEYGNIVLPMPEPLRSVYRETFDQVLRLIQAAKDQGMTPLELHAFETDVLGGSSHSLFC